MYWLPELVKIIMTCSLPHPEHERQRSVNDFWSCILGSHTADRLQTVIKKVLAAFMAKQIVIPSLPHLENERRQSVDDCWSCILGNLGGDRLQTVKHGVLATFIGKRDSETLPAPT